MTVFRVHSNNGKIYNPAYPRRDVMGLLAKQIEQYSNPPRISIQLPAHHQATPFALKPKDKNTLVIDFRWLGYAAGLRALPDFSTPYDKAGSEAEGLARLINGLRKIAPDCPVDVVAHRLGARVALMAISTARSKMWRSLLLSNAFEYSARTLAALDCPMGKHLKFHNIITHHKNITSFFFDHFGPKPGPADRAICFGYKFPHANWSEVLDTDLAVTKLLLDMGANTFALTPPHLNPVFNVFGQSFLQSLTQR
jgi:pimeloyl-ACP methyl ester carboxylesterase